MGAALALALAHAKETHPFNATTSKTIDLSRNISFDEFQNPIHPGEDEPALQLRKKQTLFTPPCMRAEPDSPAAPRFAKMRDEEDEKTEETSHIVLCDGRVVVPEVTLAQAPAAEEDTGAEHVQQPRLVVIQDEEDEGPRYRACKDVAAAVLTALAMASTWRPWFNKKTDEGLPPADRAMFVEVLRRHLVGARLADPSMGETPNLYLAFGFASQGYGEWESVERALEQWCQQNDERHRQTGWILMTQGDGDYGKKSIETIAQYVAARGTPVVFMQSDYGYAEPGSAYWPTYASAGFFGPGLYHQQAKLGQDGQPRVGKDGAVMLKEAWGGYVKDLEGMRTGELAFPDAAMLEESFDERLSDHLGGIFIAGGGDITAEQVEVYQFGQAGREGDCFVPAVTEGGVESKLNSMLAPTFAEPTGVTVPVVTGNEERNNELDRLGKEVESQLWSALLTERQTVVQLREESLIRASKL